MYSPVPGLDDVIALQSTICHLSAEDGRLSYRGYQVQTLAELSSFEETAHLLVRGTLPTGGELRFFKADLRGAQKLSPAMLRLLKALPAGTDPMNSLRAALAILAAENQAPLPPSQEIALRQGLRLIGVAPTVVAAAWRLSRGERPITPKKSLSLAANFLLMLSGTQAVAEAERAFDAGLILRADNELNPSTFAARVTAATGADVFGAVITGLSALAGPRHGWHARNVMAALEEIGAAEQVAEWVRRRMAENRKLPGFGHQVYRGEDPRTGFLRTLTQAQCERAGQDALYRTARELESVVLRETGQYPIVDFYLAPLYRALGIPTELFTAVFAISRMPGWVAHTLEQYASDKLIRPRAEYIGPVEQEYRPVRRRR